MDSPTPPPPKHSIVELRQRARRNVERAHAVLAQIRDRVQTVDVGMAVYERDKEAAGTLLGTALAVRMFLFCIPLILLTLGIAGLLGTYAGADSLPSGMNLSGTLADEIGQAFDQGSVTPWVAVVLGAFGVATTGYSLTRAMVLSSALSWQLGGGRQRTPVRVIGIVVGIVVSMVVVLMVVRRIDEASGPAISSVSFMAVAPAYFVLWSLLFLSLPRGTSDPGAVLPGALVVALLVTAMHALSQLVLTRRIESADSLYGAVGVAVAIFGWFYFLGRGLAFGFAVNAVLYERIGSVSEFVFDLPGLRVLPRRWPALARFFDLDSHEAR